jgi:hypothetical protein
MTFPNRYLLGSDVLIEYLRGRDQAVNYIDDLEGELLISVIAVAELFAGTRVDSEREAMDRFLSPLTAIPIGYLIANQGGQYRGQYRQSHGMSLNDAIIAAKARFEEAVLVSFNKRRFPIVADLIIPYDRL